MESQQQEKIKIIAEAIKENKYDVIALQEVNQSVGARLVFDNVKEDNFALVILNQLQKMGCSDYKMVWDFSHIGYHIYEEGLAILSKHEIIDSKSIFISKNTDKNYWKARLVVRTSIKFDKEIIDFYSCHLGWWNDSEEDFSKQADRLLNSINQNRLTFLMGDFNNNACVRNQGYDYLLCKGIYDTFMAAEQKDAGVTVRGNIDGWEGNNENLRLDLILTNMIRPVKHSRVIFNGCNRAVVSDHYGVEISILL